MIKNADNEGNEVSERWKIFANFVTDMGTKPNPESHVFLYPGKKIYSKENCTWKDIDPHANKKKVPAALVKKIREEYEPGDKTLKKGPGMTGMPFLAKKYKLSQETIFRIVHGRYWNEE